MNILIDELKKVLIIAYLFPPRPGIGAQRPFKLAKYLPMYGWEPVILTPKLHGNPPEGYRVIETDYRDNVSYLKSKIGFKSDKGVHQQLGITVSKNYDHSSFKSKLLKIGKEIACFPDEQIGWFKYALKKAEGLLLRENIDVILSTSYPVTSHLIARKLKHKFNIPWIADFRDPWTQNPYVDKFDVIKFFERRLELKTISDADLLVTVTRPWIDLLKALHKGKEVYCITNGFDDDDFLDNTTDLTDKFTITYTGMLYNGKRDPSMLFDVVSQLINENKIRKDLIDIRFYGPVEGWLQNIIDKYNLKGAVHLNGSISRDEAIEKQRESQLLLLLLWNDKKEEGFCPGKIYEYFGSKRPIVAIGGSRSIVKDMIKQSKAGQYADNPKLLKNIVYDYYQEFINNGEVKYNLDHNTHNYSYKVISKKYADHFNRLTLK